MCSRMDELVPKRAGPLVVVADTEVLREGRQTSLQVVRAKSCFGHWSASYGGDRSASYAAGDREAAK